MSWYLANQNGIIDQFASGGGLTDLSREIEKAVGCAALKDFFEVGVTKNIVLCMTQLAEVATQTKDESVKGTALGLAKIMGGQRLVSITQGFGNADDEADSVEDRHGPRQTAARATKKASPTKKPNAREAKKKATPRKGQAWFQRKVGELKAEAEKLPADRQTVLKRALKKGK
jgi:hypothetical protein